MEQNSTYDPKKKVLLTYKDLDGEFKTESLWAEKVGDNYKILNIPFFAHNIAYGDIVSVERDGGQLYFEELIKESGHSTIQIIIFKKELQKDVEEEFIKLGCDWEGSHLQGYISVDVPDTLPYEAVKKYLQKSLSEDIFDYREACLSAVHRKGKLK